MVDAAAAIANALPLLKEYQLCRHCLLRQAGASKRAAADKCYICKGLFGRLDEIAKKAFLATKQYQFDTFLVGATLPTQPYEREDALRARLKIRGRESIKNQLTRELGTRLSKITRKKANYLRPDLTINVVIGKNGEIEATARSRPLALLCRYAKRERGLPQKAGKCPLCLGKGCNLCDGTGLDGLESVEGIVAKHIMKMTGGQAPKFSWMGSEDQSSLVLGKGRPFYAKVSDPKVRKPRKTKFAEAGVEGKVVKVLDDVPDTQARFMVKTRIACKCDRAIVPDDIKKLKKSLAGAQAKFENRSKMAVKKIHSVQAKKTAESELVLTILADGGLPIKQFVGGEQYIEPNVSSLLSARCECTTFDILKVDLLDAGQKLSNR
ncbi:tRNA pseudouridine(54/55) synthase Pus10 [Nitrososphaera viennensis]|uniref:tRNA pseudouridine(55) synthase n=2 Tax=Nitrososphaera viennensis TaxID=1034015 RepID=A0A060HH03_9ARCH|nr:tRNA pseudouridine(54/55) synthase Pus10 [Nitrososphaera viennensis]AIC15864.1 putative pseudouridylate synthase-like protein [Nitrososphaera viennensis EN76]UVS67853.1 tRNA pseudouridine(54/55) synthase Pus10 [Nitrososphaera viennensis]